MMEVNSIKGIYLPLSSTVLLNGSSTEPIERDCLGYPIVYENGKSIGKYDNEMWEVKLD